MTSPMLRRLLALAVLLPLAAGAQSRPAAKATSKPAPAAATPATPTTSVPLPPPPGTKPADPTPAKKQKLAVLEIRALGTEAARAELVSEIALTEASAVKGYDVVGKSDIVAMLGFEKQKAVLGCSDDSACLAELGGALGVDLVMVGSLGRIGALYRLDLKLVDAKKAKIRGRVGVNVEGQEEKIVAATQRAVRALLDPDAKGSLGTGPVALDLSAPAAPPKPRGLGWTAIGAGVLSVGLGAFAVYEGTTAKSKYSTASGMLEGGVLKVDASAASYSKAVSDGNSAKTMAYVGGGAAVGCAVVSGILGYYSYKKYGEIGPIRF
jgi:hypothetical protein